MMDLVASFHFAQIFHQFLDIRYIIIITVIIVHRECDSECYRAMMNHSTNNLPIRSFLFLRLDECFGIQPF